MPVKKPQGSPGGIQPGEKGSATHQPTPFRVLSYTQFCVQLSVPFLAATSHISGPE